MKELIYYLLKNKNYVLILIALLFTGCAGHKVLLDFPPYTDNLPQIATGFYTVHQIVNGSPSEEMGSEFLGKLVYLYKEDFFVDKKYFSGINGSFLPNYYIKSKLVISKTVYYWQDAESDDVTGDIEFYEITQDKLLASITNDKNKKEEIEFRFYRRQISGDSLKVFPIAHRGLCYQPPNNYDGIFPANTFPAFESALVSGYKGFELDVRVTKDKRFIISHDEDLSAATTLHGYVKDKNLSELENALVIKSAFIPEKKETAYEAFIAAPIRSLYDVLYHFIDDPRLEKMVVDIKPDTDENLLAAARHDFEGLTEEQQKKILFLTRTESSAKLLKELCPFADIALEGSLGPEPVEELEKYYPEAVGLPRQSHNTISFGANLILTAKSIETSQEMIGKAMELSSEYDYKIIMWTFAKDWKLNFLGENKFYPDLILLDIPYYQYALHQMKYASDNNLIFADKDTSEEIFSNPIYKRVYNSAIKDFWFQSRTLLELTYGQGNPKHSNFTSNFAPVGNWELKLGRSEINKFSQTNTSLNEWYIFFSYLNSNSALTKPEANEVSTEFYKFGFGRTEGYGYYWPRISFVPFVSQSWLWTKLNDFEFTQDGAQADLPPNDTEIMNRYSDAFRFSDRVLYGFKSDILSSVQLTANYETSIIYPRHLFYKWAASSILVEAGYLGIDYVLGKFVDDYPVVGPIINILVRSGYLYSYYLLRKNNMNWPFITETPLRYEGFNFGVSVVL
jgi:glycerophosphoryl diester phosphodiesterase